MGSLYEGDANKPATDANLCAIWVTADCNVSLAEDSTRGGIVMEDANAPGSVSLLGEQVICGKCFPSSKPSYQDWLDMGEPACWCAPTYQCFGDANGDTETLANYRIYGNDITKVSNNWKKKIDDATLDPCADVDHDDETLANYRVYSNDISRISTYWKKKDADLDALGSCPDYFTR
jgi:hypothetical protein